MFARRVIFVVNLPLPEGDMTEAAAPQRDPAARAVLPHHDLGPHSDQVVTTETNTVTVSLLHLYYPTHPALSSLR